MLGELVGHSAPIQQVFSLIQQVAPSRAAVLVTGESGTGKELVARTVHALSPRRDGPFVAVNCAAMPETLMESELFGHEKGAFTGAVERRAGCFELAQQGTLLLDEIGDMPVGTQAKLLRVLEDSRIRRLGGKSEIEVDVRVVASTNKPLEESLRKGEIREDLYYRINVFRVHLPPLRERKEDIAPLCDALLDSLNRKHGCKVTDVQPEVMQAFQSYHWPGNVRELRNILERAVVIAGEGTVSTAHLPLDFGVSEPERRSSESADPNEVRLRVGTTVDEGEKALILKTLEHTRNNKTRAAEILGISLKTLHNKLKEYGSAADEAAGE
jgi:transcriptional regulator with PAS, ATPase and Fis domain